jgi:mannose-6-phosphate isomerase-like protein (cupin superfamily)
LALDADYTVKRLDEVEGSYGGGFKRVRAALGVESFGIQVVELPPSSGDLAPEHDHASDGQEEVYLLLEGSGELVLPDRKVSLDRETFVRVGATTRRRLRSGPDGMRVLALGGVPRRAYEAPANTELGGPEGFNPGASTAIVPDSPPPQISA